MHPLNSFRGRAPYLLAAACFACGEWTGFALSPVSQLWPFALVLSIAALAWIVGAHARRPWAYALFLAGAVLSMRAAESRGRALDGLLDMSGGKSVAREFKIPDTVRYTEDGAKTVVSFPASVDSIPCFVNVTFDSPRGSPRPGERWRFSGRLARGRGVLDSRRRAFRCGVRSGTPERLSPAPRFDTDAFFHRARESLSARMSDGIEDFPDVADLNRAILLGERHRMPKDRKESFVSAGAIHIFAISGLHVLIIAKLVVILLALACIPSRFHTLFLVPLLWAYVRLTGMAPSAVRAATMAGLWYGAYLFWRRPDPLVAWTIAFFFAFVPDPFMILNPGALLSFVVMLSLVALPVILPDTESHFAGDIRATAVAWAAGVPIIAHLFGRFTPAGLIANIVMMPLVVASVVSSALALGVGFFCRTLAGFLNRVSCYATGTMDAVSSLLSSIPFLDFQMAKWSFAACAAWYAFFAFAAVAVGKALSLRSRMPY